MRTRQENTNKPNRPQRVPLHEQRDKIAVRNRDPNYTYRWVVNNNASDPDRVDRFLRAGWEVDTDSRTTVGDPGVDDQLNKTSSVKERHMGGGQKATLMRIKNEWYEEDQAAKQRKVDESEEAMKREVTKDRYGDFKLERK